MPNNDNGAEGDCDSEQGEEEEEGTTWAAGWVPACAESDPFMSEGARGQSVGLMGILLPSLPLVGRGQAACPPPCNDDASHNALHVASRCSTLEVETGNLWKQISHVPEEE